jgi:NADH dehydrogenase
MIRVEPNLAVTGHDNVYALASLPLCQDGQPLPALAQVAQQQGRHLGQELRKPKLPALYRYRSKGDPAVIGRHAAVYLYGRCQLTGWIAWLLCSIIHIYLLIGFERRALVMTQWVWRYFTFERGARLID